MRFIFPIQNQICVLAATHRTSSANPKIQACVIVTCAKQHQNYMIHDCLEIMIL